jgi:hypothetical protein
MRHTSSSSSSCCCCCSSSSSSSTFSISYRKMHEKPQIQSLFLRGQTIYSHSSCDYSQFFNLNILSTDLICNAIPSCFPLNSSKKFRTWLLGFCFRFSSQGPTFRRYTLVRDFIHCFEAPLLRHIPCVI